MKRLSEQVGITPEEFIDFLSRDLMMGPGPRDEPRRDDFQWRDRK